MSEPRKRDRWSVIIIYKTEASYEWDAYGMLSVSELEFIMEHIVKHLQERRAVKGDIPFRPRELP